MNKAIQFYGHEKSRHAYKVALALQFGQIPHEYIHVDIEAEPHLRPQEFQNASRWNEVPCLIIHDEPLIQSGAILIRLVEEFEILGGTSTLSRANEWLFWEANRIGMCIPQIHAHYQNLARLAPDALAWLIARYEIDHMRLTHALEQSPFLLGEEFSIADIAVFGYVHKVKDLPLPLSNAVTEWIDRMQNRPHFATPERLLGERK